MRQEVEVDGDEMDQLTLEQKALRVVERLVSGDISEDASFKLAIGRDFTQEEAKTLAEKVVQIYRISHSSVPEHICFEVHEDWRKETLSMFRRLKRKG